NLICLVNSFFYLRFLIFKTMKKIYSILTILLLMGCSKDDVVVDDNLIKNYHISYMMDYPTLTPFYPNPDDILIKLEYSNNKISKRIGDVYRNYAYGAVDISYFANYIYDEVSYLHNKIVIE